MTAGPNLGGEVAKRSWVEHLMGMPVSVLLRGPHVGCARVAAEVALVYEELHRAEGIFSMFRTDSDVRRWIRRELALDWLESLDGYEGLVVDRDGRVGTTAGFDVPPEPGDVSGAAS